MRLGLGFVEDVPLGAQRALAREVEAAGISSLWANDGTGRDPLLVCQAWGDATTRLRVGIGVLQLPTRTPAQVAKAAMTLQEATGGRLLLGLGPSQSAAMGCWHGVEWRRPLAATRDAMAIIAALCRGDSTDHDGAELRSHGFRLDISPQPARVPLYLGARGPRMLALAGGQADGVLLSWESPETVRRAAERVRASAVGAGRALPDIAAYVRVAVSRDRCAARRALAEQVAAFWPYYAEHFASQGIAFGADGELDDEALMSVGWFGTPHDDPRPMLRRYEDAGLDHLVARVVPVGDPHSSVRDVLSVLACFASAS